MMMDHGVRSYDRAPTRIRRARPGPNTRSAYADPNSYGSRTMELGLMTGHRLELDVPDQDPIQDLPMQIPTPMVPEPRS
ncbi:hypothetical protein TIFTF001_030295 [Ficus carica]|uniref:Uncharacterized protein n=1 Tax=Ficus carica TaxID=3494 RepID=A0AA88DSY0_FICCA|nr:hypothetical protein TIFTF001_030295 [Ficus carica]